MNICDKSSNSTFTEMLAQRDYRAIGQSYYGLSDQIFDTKKAFADPAVVPRGPNGEPDFLGAERKQLLATVGTHPGSDDEARRWCLLTEGFEGCHPDTALLAWMEPDTNRFWIRQIAGRDEDHDAAVAIVSSALGLTPVTAPREPANMDLRVPPGGGSAPGGFGITAEALLGLQFAPVNYCVPGYIAEGLTLLGGRPKLGKSWLALGFGIAVASGGHTLGVACDQGDVFYLALEDNQRRLQSRLQTLMPKLVKRPDLSRLTLDTESPKIGAGLIERLEAWRKSAANPRLIIVDTLAMVRPQKGRNQDSYSADYEALSPLQRFASEHRLAIVVVTHVRKAEADDPLEMISGTNGLTGAADATFILNRTADGPKLYGRGRDIEEVDKALRFDAGHWSVLGDTDDVKRSGERRKIMRALEEAQQPLSPAQIAESTGMKSGNIRYLLGAMVKAGEIEKTSYGSYISPPHTPHTPNTSDPSTPLSIHYPPHTTNCEECEGCEEDIQSEVQ